MRTLLSPTRLGFRSYLLLLTTLTIIPEINAQSAASNTTTANTTTAYPRPSIELPESSVDPAINATGNVTLLMKQQVYADASDIYGVKLVTQNTNVKKTDDLPRLVESMGIKWDISSIRLIYDLNPTLADIRSVPDGAILLLPKIETDSYFAARMRLGYPVSLKMDSTAREVALAREAELRRFSDSLQKIPPSRFSRPEDKAAIIESVEFAWRALSTINSDRSPASQKVLRQSILEAEKLKSFLEVSIKPNGFVDSSRKEEAAEISAALHERSTDIKNGGSGRANVEVHTVKQSDGSPVKLLRVFYRPKYDEKKIDKYRDPSTPTSEPLAVGGTFILWAGKGDDPTPLSDRQIIEVASRDNRPVKLLVKD